MVPKVENYSIKDEIWTVLQEILKPGVITSRQNFCRSTEIAHPVKDKTFDFV